MGQHHPISADDYSSDALSHISSGMEHLTSNPQGEVLAGLGYAILALDNRVRELLLLLDDRL